MPRTITQDIFLNCSREEAFHALITPSSIQQWWSAQTAIVLPEKGGFYAVSWGHPDDPEYMTCACISEFRRPEYFKLTDYQYYSKSGGLPFDNDLPVEFSLSAQDGSTKLVVRQTGFPDNRQADPYYQGCVSGWQDTLAAFKKVMEA